MTSRRLAAAVLALLLAPWWALPAAAEQGSGDPQVRARLVASPGSLGAPSERLVGVRFDIEPGWHIYWKYPGGAGLATDIRWQLPEGVEAGPLQWPLPIAFTQSDDIPGYGYEGSVVLAAALQSAGRPPAAEETVGAEVSWLACKDVCVLGGAELEGVLGELPSDPAFASWSEQLAAPYRPKEATFTVTTTGGLDDERLTLWLDWQGTEPLATTWFPDPPEGLEVGEAAVRTRGGLTRIDAPLRRLAGADSTKNTLRSLLVVTGGDGSRRGWELTTDLEN